MRKKTEEQMPLMPCDIEHPRAKELDRISKLFDSIPTITNMVLQDLTRGVKHRHCGAQGVSAQFIFPVKSQGKIPVKKVGLPAV